MKNENGQNQLNKNLKEHRPFDVYEKDGSYFEEYKYDEELKRYQSEYGYLTIEGVIQIAKDKEDIREIVWR